MTRTVDPDGPLGAAPAVKTFNVYDDGPIPSSVVGLSEADRIIAGGFTRRFGGIAEAAYSNVFLEFIDDDASTPGDAVLSKRYLHGPLVDQVLAEEDAATDAILWYLTDNLGSVRDVLDADGDVAVQPGRQEMLLPGFP